MNDTIKYLVTGAAIAIVSGFAGTMGGVCLMKATENSESAISKPRYATSGASSPITIQPSGTGNQSVFSGQRIQQNPAITIPPRSGGSNVAFRPTSPNGKMLMNQNQFQKLQEQPEVKAARDVFMNAQKKYTEAIRKAMEQSQGTVATAKTGPITIQVPPVGSTNGVAKTKM